jgi:hypothetical protein
MRHMYPKFFPQSGTLYCRFQIARSINSDFQKVKENVE